MPNRDPTLYLALLVLTLYSSIVETFAIFINLMEPFAFVLPVSPSKEDLLSQNWSIPLVHPSFPGTSWKRLGGAKLDGAWNF